MAAIDALDASAVRRWCAAAVDGLAARRAEIDDLNVFPVPDGDTGTNMLLTLRAADEAVRAEAGGVDELLAAMARAAVLGAKGNSGVILSQVLRGVAEGLAGTPARGSAVAAALALGSELAWGAVGEPVEGTMLSVARAAADAAAGVGDDLPEVVRAAARGAAEALAVTPRQLAPLARAGVVDAGGRGLVVLLEALAGVVTGATGTAGDLRVVRDRGALEAERESGSADFAYEVQFLLDAPEPAVPPLREELAGLGDSLVVVGTGDDRWTVHVHVNDVGAAIEAGIEAGRVHRITVTRFADTAGAAARTGVAVLALAPGPGVADLFAAEGVVVVDGPFEAGDLVTAIAGTKAAAAVVLPCSAAATAVADAAAVEAREAGTDVAVVPTRSAVQGLAAVAVHDESRRFGDDVIAMAEAAAATRSAEVVVAGRDALTMAGPCRAGDVLGLAEGDVVVIGDAVGRVAGDLIDRMLSGGGELVTLLVGDGAPGGLAEELERRVAHDHPGVEVTAYAGGQPEPLLIGVE